MALGGKLLTEREKAALYYHVFGGLQDWRTIYKVADAKTDGKQEIKFLDIYISKWKNSDKVRRFIETLQKQKADNEAEERNKGRTQERERREESEHTGGEEKPKVSQIIDYSDPKNRQHLYNRVIAEAKNDPKTQLDAAKMFEQIQKDDREAAKAQKQNRVYLPLRCYECPLYQKAAKKTIK